MFRFALVLLGSFLFAADADACGRAGVFSRARSRIVHRERVVDRSHGGLLGFGFFGARVMTAAPCGPAVVVAPVVPVPMPKPKK